jgi:hypothetical protein
VDARGIFTHNKQAWHAALPVLIHFHSPHEKVAGGRNLKVVFFRVDADLLVGFEEGRLHSCDKA